MKRDFELILQLEELVLTQKKHEVMCQEPADLEELADQICKLRRQISSDLLSRFDRLSRDYADVITMIQDQTCQGCGERVSRRLVLKVRDESCAFCENCGRFLISAEAAPKYLD